MPAWCPDTFVLRVAADYTPAPVPRVVVAPDAATRLAVADEWLAAQPLDAEVLVVGPTWEACDDLVRSAVVQARARFGTVRLTLDRLAARLATPVLAADGRVPAGGLSVTAVAARAVHLLRAATSPRSRDGPASRRRSPGRSRSSA